MWIAGGAWEDALQTLQIVAVERVAVWTVGSANVLRRQQVGRWGTRDAREIFVADQTVQRAFFAHPQPVRVSAVDGSRRTDFVTPELVQVEVVVAAGALEVGGSEASFADLVAQVAVRTVVGPLARRATRHATCHVQHVTLEAFVALVGSGAETQTAAGSTAAAGLNEVVLVVEVGAVGALEEACSLVEIVIDGHVGTLNALRSRHTAEAGWWARSADVAGIIAVVSGRASCRTVESSRLLEVEIVGAPPASCRTIAGEAGTVA